MTPRTLMATIVLALALTTTSADAFHHYRRYVPCAGPRLDYAPYAIAPVASFHGPSAFGPGLYGAPVTPIRPPALYAPTSFYRSYYAPLSYGYGYRGFYHTAFASPYRFGGYGVYGTHFTRYGLYGGAYGFAPLTVGYPYATGYINTVRPIQPYHYAFHTTAVPATASVVTTAYVPCVYGAYGLGGF